MVLSCSIFPRHSRGACCGALAFLLGLTACQTSPLVTVPAPVEVATATPTPPAPEPERLPAPLPATDPADAAARDWLAWHQQWRNLSPEAMSQEAVRLNDATAAASSPAATMRLALALSLTRGGADAARALSLLEQVQRSPAPEAKVWQPWARTLSVRLQEQRRLEDQIERQNQQLRDGQRRIDQLNEKIEALRAIERSLSRTPARTPP